MPIYEYRCKNCGHKIETMQKISDPPVTVCEKCKGTMSKVISPAGLMFKGSGWYITDYSSKGKPSDEPSKSVKNNQNNASEKNVSEKKEEKPAEPTAAKPDKTEPAT